MSIGRVRFMGREVDAEWQHWRVTSVSVAQEDPYHGWWLNGREPGVIHVQFIDFRDCHHTPEVGEVYSQLNAIEEPRYTIAATLGEETVYDRRDKE